MPYTTTQGRREEERVNSGARQYLEEAQDVLRELHDGRVPMPLLLPPHACLPRSQLRALLCITLVALRGERRMRIERGCKCVREAEKREVEKRLRRGCRENQSGIVELYLQPSVACEGFAEDGHERLTVVGDESQNHLLN
jgi:hypothetical protein